MQIHLNNRGFVDNNRLEQMLRRLLTLVFLCAIGVLIQTRTASAGASGALTARSAVLLGVLGVIVHSATGVQAYCDDDGLSDCPDGVVFTLSSCNFNHECTTGNGDNCRKCDA
jgi:hypothetical protein